MTCTCGNTFDDPQHGDERRRSTPTSAAPATRSTRASRRSSTPVAGSPGSRQRYGKSGSAAASSASTAPARIPVWVPSGAARFVRREGSWHHERCERRSSRSLAEYADLERRLADPAVHADPAAPRRSGRRYAELAGWSSHLPRLAAGGGRPRGRPRARRGRSRVRRRAARRWRPRRDAAGDRCAGCSSPATPTTPRDVILEVKAGEGGEESALFAGDLLRMYLRYAERRGWGTEVLEATESDLGGYKDVSVAIKARGIAAAGRGVLGAPEVRGRRAPRAAGAGHRVAGPHPHLRGRRARPPRGRGRGRGRDRPERPADRRLPLVRPRRPEREHHRLRRADHAPADGHRRVLPEREVAAAEQGAGPADPARPAARAPSRRRPRRPASARDARQVRTVDRSERIRTYNFPENRIADHRIGYKAYNLDQVLDGDLGRGRSSPRSTPTRPRGSRPRTADEPDRSDPACGAVRDAARVLADAGVPSPGHDAARARRAPARRHLAPAAGAPQPRRRLPRARTTAARRASGRPRAAPAPRRRGRPSATWSWRCGPACSCRARRPSWSRGWRSPSPRGAAARPLVVDLCAGSGAIALAVATEAPGAGGGRRRRAGRRRLAGRNAAASGAGRPRARATPRRRPARRPRRRGRRGRREPAVHPAGRAAPSTPRCASTTRRWPCTAADRTGSRCRVPSRRGGAPAARRGAVRHGARRRAGTRGAGDGRRDGCVRPTCGPCRTWRAGTGWWWRAGSGRTRDAGGPVTDSASVTVDCTDPATWGPPSTRPSTSWPAAGSSCCRRTPSTASAPTRSRPAAVAALLAAKGRGRRCRRPCSSRRRAHGRRARARTCPTTSRALVEAFWPGPLTVICRAQPSLAWDLGDTDGTVAAADARPSRRARAPAPHRPARRLQREPHGGAGRDHRGAGARRSSATASPSTSTPAGRRAASPRRSSTRRGAATILRRRPAGALDRSTTLRARSSPRRCVDGRASDRA